MKRLQFDYCMEIRYTVPVSICHFTIKCIPKNDARQHLLGMHIAIEPQAAYSFGEDSYGNRQIYGRVEEAHERFSFHIEGEVEIGQILYEEEAVEERVGLYRFPFGKCRAGEQLGEYYRTLDFSECKSAYDKCLVLMHRLYQDFSYERAATGIETTAEEAWRLGRGVCQDYAHIYITLLRMAGVPARYVCGLIVGEGASHAWVEALCGGRWIGLDPTNDCLVADSHIKLGDGRDASECAINRGVMRGGGAQTQRISVTVRDSTVPAQKRFGMEE
ncbi:MAG: transglutaminase family protein [Roseburia sp.]|nr:transglutaminase family protein [Roseburia sp.]